MKVMMLSLMVLLTNPWAWAEGCGQGAANMIAKTCSVEQSDALVNSAYMHLLEVLGRQFKLDQIKALYQAQDAWQIYRDKSCLYLGAGFTPTETIQDDCHIRLNDVRIKQLTEYTTEALTH